MDRYGGSGQVGRSGSWNRYSFGLNDPLNHADPSGLCVVDGIEYPDGDAACPNDTSVDVDSICR